LSQKKTTRLNEKSYFSVQFYAINPLGGGVKIPKPSLDPTAATILYDVSERCGSLCKMLADTNANLKPRR